MLRWVAWANFDPWCFFEEASKQARSSSLPLQASPCLLRSAIMAVLDRSQFTWCVSVTHRRPGLLSMYSFSPFCACQRSWIALQHCWQNSYLPHPWIPSHTLAHSHTHTHTHVLFSLWIQSQSSPAPLFPTPGWAQILSALCKPALLCHQDYRLCCSRLMTDNSTLLSALRGAHRATRRKRAPGCEGERNNCGGDNALCWSENNMLAARLRVCVSSGIVWECVCMCVCA